MKSSTILSLVGVAVILLVVGTDLGSVAFPERMTETTTASFTVTATSTSFATEKPQNSNVSIVKEVLIEHLLTNYICALQSENTTVTTTLLSAVGNSENSLFVTYRTTTISYNSTSTIYENATIISNDSTCADINPYYNVSTTNANCECV